MSRAHQAKNRTVKPDPIYNSLLLAHLINKVMLSGKKTIAQKQVYDALEQIKQKTKENPLEVLQNAIENIKPNMEVRPRRVGGAAYQVPIPVRGQRRETLALRWLVKAAHSRENKEFHSFSQKLAQEILEAVNKQGQAINKREEVHRLAEANKAFAHFRW